MSPPFGDYGLTESIAAISAVQPEAGPSRPRYQADVSIEDRVEALTIADHSAVHQDQEIQSWLQGGHGDATSSCGERVERDGFWYKQYQSESDDLDNVIRLVEAELSEPYNLYTFRYFLIEWPHLAYLVYPSETSQRAIGVIVCKTDSPLYGRKKRGYIAMLSIEPGFRRMGIASHMVKQCIIGMHSDGVREVVIETESDNSNSLALYDKLGFRQDKRLHRFYSNGKDAYRLILPLDPSSEPYPSYSALHPPPARIALSVASLPISGDPTYTGQQDDDSYSETASEVSYGRWEVASGPEWLETLEEPEAVLRGLGGEPGRPEPAPEGAQWMLGQMMRERAEAEMRASQAGPGQDGTVQGDLVDANDAHDGTGIAEGGTHGMGRGIEGSRPDTPALRKPDLPPRPEHGHLYDGMYL